MIWWMRWWIWRIDSAVGFLWYRHTLQRALLEQQRRRRLYNWRPSKEEEEARCEVEIGFVHAVDVERDVILWWRMIWRVQRAVADPPLFTWCGAY